MAGVQKFKFDIIMPDDEKPKVTFNDVGGHMEAKEELSEIVDFLKNRGRYTRLGAKIPSGALLSGPPGNGKTLLARAIAGEAAVPFISTAGPQFIDKIGGLGPKRMRDIFSTATNIAPCILFIDEIDAIGKSRKGGQFTGVPQDGANNEAHNTINQMLVEMDGLSSRAEIFVMCATNMDEVLDKALTRPGRLDRKIYIDNPTELDRIEIFRIYMSKLKLKIPSITKYCIRLAECTPNYSGAQIENICNEAAIYAARFAKSAVTESDFEEAIERVTVGLERRHTSVTEEEKNLSAYYEAGQAVLSLLLPSLTPTLKASITARLNKPLGFIQFTPKKDLLYKKEYLIDNACRGLAGRASQVLFLNQNTTQAQEDFKRVSDMIYSFVADHGMGKSASNMSFQETRSQIPRRINLWSDRLQAEMDTEVREILDEQYNRALDFLESHRELVEIIVKELLSRKTLTGDDITQLYETFKEKQESKTPC